MSYLKSKIRTGIHSPAEFRSKCFLKYLLNWYLMVLTPGNRNAWIHVIDLTSAKSYILIILLHKHTPHTHIPLFSFLIQRFLLISSVSPSLLLSDLLCLAVQLSELNNLLILFHTSLPFLSFFSLFLILSDALLNLAVLKAFLLEFLPFFQFEHRNSLELIFDGCTELQLHDLRRCRILLSHLLILKAASVL